MNQMLKSLPGNWNRMKSKANLDIIFQIEAKLGRTSFEHYFTDDAIRSLRLETDDPRRIIRLRRSAPGDLYHFLHENEALFSVIRRLGLGVTVQ